MRLCTLYLCIREIRKYTDREYCATFTFCSSTVSVAIYATHKKTDRGRAVERERVKDVPQSALQCWLQAQLFSSGRASRSAFAFNFTEKRCTFNGRPMQGGGMWGVAWDALVACRCDAFQSVFLLNLGHGYQIRQTSAVSISPYPLFPSVSVSRNVTETNLKY